MIGNVPVTYTCSLPQQMSIWLCNGVTQTDALVCCAANAEKSSGGGGPWKPLGLVVGVVAAGLLVFTRIKGGDGKSS